MTYFQLKYVRMKKGWIKICYKYLYVCMSFIFRKSFTRYGNSHITNSKKHSNI